MSASDWCRRRRERGSLYTSMLARTHSRGFASATAAVASRDTSRLRSECSATNSICSAAASSCRVDPDRPPAAGYTPIDWYVDPVRRLRFPRGVPYKQWNLYEMRPKNADIKYPWELAAASIGRRSGQAFRLTGDDRFAVEIARELDDFVEANPIGIGVNWTCTMDVGLRAVSWAIGLELVRASRGLDDAVLDARVLGAVRPRRLHPQQPREHLRSHQQSLPQQRRSAC